MKDSSSSKSVSAATCPSDDIAAPEEALLINLFLSYAVALHTESSSKEASSRNTNLLAICEIRDMYLACFCTERR